ncbi:hypothetical protein C2S53_011310 [Perilla frutescens var. hirtella]|uniref:Uncharacterized protein n=1 Tax=Perilla frutescens var. hirtella TaxID=608512 RepID=A0AAD4P1Z9_PERFH|nr:hypothetical protein C2S53_011310 [Perilla frutescens var. hirtella]
MLLTVRTARFLLIFVLVAGTLSTAYLLVQGGDYHAADEEYNLVVPEKKAMQTIGNVILIGRKMVSDDYDSTKMETMMKEKNERSKYTRNSRKLMRRENYRARFVAFNEDYKGPRRHPPKNN